MLRHDVEVRRLQQLGLARLHPGERLRSLALRTMPIATTVEGNGRVRTTGVLATRDVATSCGACRARRAAVRQLSIAFITFTCAWLTWPRLARRVMPKACKARREAVIAEDIRDLQSWMGHERPWLQRAALPGVERRQQIERARHVAQHLRRHVGVARRRVELRVTQRSRVIEYLL